MLTFVQARRNKRVTINSPGHAHELTFSCFRRLPLLRHDPIRRILIDVLEETRKKFDLQVWAYVLMPEHVHLLICPNQREYKIQNARTYFRRTSAIRALAWLRKNSSADLEKLFFQTCGKYRFWQAGGGYDRNLWSPPAVWSSIEYIHMNPVKRGLCESPCDWLWSLARCYAETVPVAFRVDRCTIEHPESMKCVFKVWREPE